MDTLIFLLANVVLLYGLIILLTRYRRLKRNTHTLLQDLHQTFSHHDPHFPARSDLSATHTQMALDLAHHVLHHHHTHNHQPPEA